MLDARVPRHQRYLGVANLNDDMVADLKNEIVVPGLFAADGPVIWEGQYSVPVYTFTNFCSHPYSKVSIPITQKLESLVKDCQLLEQTPLLEADQLSDLNPDPVPKTLHIIA